MSDLEFKAQVKQILRKLASELESHILASSSDSYDTSKLREVQELIEEI